MPKIRRKPKKPRPDFPLTAHRNGQWCKKIRGKIHYFGTDADAALTKYLDQKEDLQAGRQPPATTGGLTLADVVNSDLANADERLVAGKLSALSFRDYKWVGTQMLAHFGRNVDPTEIRRSEFTAFRRKMDTNYAPSRLTKTITVCKRMFSWTYEEQELIDTLSRWGKKFKAASKKEGRQAKEAAGPKSFKADELWTLIEAASSPLSAMVLLGVNAGFGKYGRIDSAACCCGSQRLLDRICTAEDCYTSPSSVLA